MFDWQTHKNKEKKDSGGGGGRSKVRLGKVGARGRRFAKPPKGIVAVVKSRYLRAGKGSHASIREHLKYLIERERAKDEPERRFFNSSQTGFERKDVYQTMMEGRGDWAAMHTIMLSPGDNSVDLTAYTRESMAALEERLGVKLEWYAVEHKNTDHHHAHVVVAGQAQGHEREESWQKRSSRKTVQWKNEERDTRELLGPGFDEPAMKSYREERALEYKLRGNEEERELEPTDPAVKELYDGPIRYPGEVMTERALNRYDRNVELVEKIKERGEVYIDRGDLQELRAAGNDYLARERSSDREIDLAIERETARDVDFGFDREPDHSQTREDDREQSSGPEREQQQEERQIDDDEHGHGRGHR